MMYHFSENGRESEEIRPREKGKPKIKYAYEESHEEIVKIYLVQLKRTKHGYFLVQYLFLGHLSMKLAIPYSCLALYTADGTCNQALFS